jgi:hypothetical protein
MYRTIIVGGNGRERGRGAGSLTHAISMATGARHRRRLQRIVESDRAPQHADALLAGRVVTAR